MWLFSARAQPNTLSQEFIARYWDLEAKVSAMQLLIDDQLHELELRYKRSEQAERRLEEKRDGAASPCADDDVTGNPAIIALKKRQGTYAAQARADPLAG